MYENHMYLLPSEKHMLVKVCTISDETGVPLPVISEVTCQC